MVGRWEGPRTSWTPGPARAADAALLQGERHEGMTDVNRFQTWLSEHQYVAVWSTLCATLVILYELAAK